MWIFRVFIENDLRFSEMVALTQNKTESRDLDFLPILEISPFIVMLRFGKHWNKIDIGNIAWGISFLVFPKVFFLSINGSWHSGTTFSSQEMCFCVTPYLSRKWNIQPELLLLNIQISLFSCSLKILRFYFAM